MSPSSSASSFLGIHCHNAALRLLSKSILLHLVTLVILKCGIRSVRSENKVNRSKLDLLDPLLHFKSSTPLRYRPCLPLSLSPLSFFALFRLCCCLLVGGPASNICGERIPF